VVSRPDISLIVPTRLTRDRLGYLTELHVSLDAQAGVRWELILSLDGASPADVPRELARDPRVRVHALPFHVRAATARNLAMPRATGRWLVDIDDDDLLPPRSLALRLERAETTGLVWIAGQLADLADNGTLSVPQPLPAGRYEPGDVWQAWSSTDTRPPLGHTQLLVRTDIALRAGHGGLIQGEDYIYVLRITGEHPGEVLPDVVYYYRAHGGQMTRGADFDQFEGEVRRYSWLVGEAIHAARCTPGRHRAIAS
jgi:glycosyltransferase involved in cell wall biosynthesis